MNFPDRLMLEDRSKPTVMVIDANDEFLHNADKALERCHLLTTTAPDKAVDIMKNIMTHYILSDVYFAANSEVKAERDMRKLLLTALEMDIPVCIVTRSDSSGIPAKDGNCIAIHALHQTDIVVILKEAENGAFFRQLKGSDKKVMGEGSKTPEIWQEALNMLKNVCAKAWFRMASGGPERRTAKGRRIRIT